MATAGMAAAPLWCPASGAQAFVETQACPQMAYATYGWRPISGRHHSRGEISLCEPSGVGSGAKQSSIAIAKIGMQPEQQYKAGHNNLEKRRQGRG